MKPVIVLLLIMTLLVSCSSHTRQVAQTVCDKVSVCCKSIGSVRNQVSNCKALEKDEDVILNEADALSIFEETGKILTW